MRLLFPIPAYLAVGALWISRACAAAIPRDSTSPVDLLSILSNSANDPSLGDANLSSALSFIVSNLTDADSSRSPADLSVQSTLKKIDATFAKRPRDIISAAKAITAAGLIPPDILALLNGYQNQGLNSIHNKNPAPSGLNIYPTKATGDAPYSIPEDDLRAAIHIPSSFSYGRNGKKPLILVPGTACPAGTTFHFNFAKFASTVPNADVVWINIPGASLNDAQINAEYAAYAINYISALSNSHVAALGWSQGNLNIQWALKYWPSTRGVLDDFIAMSPDFHGTIVRDVACPLLGTLICTPSLWQQGWSTEFVHTIRRDGGDSAYVPTTTIYSTFDEIVEPMSGPHASALLGDSRGVGVTNNHIQTICPLKAAGGIYTHEGLLYNPLAWKLAADAFNNPGPGQIQRLDLDSVCAEALAPPLDLSDVVGTHGVLLVAVAELLAYLPKTTKEPLIAGYASG
ncbi:hypothetical protein BDV59DRAFT_205387 [Aspergillus ambiguus]|uniref:putative lipase n=1 Tax=Aspergillus ambiguus TaxID=176160 RepID=UPI003CCCC7F5